MKLTLIARGSEINCIGGYLDVRTRAAVYKYQLTIGMPENGKVTPDMLVALNTFTEQKCSGRLILWRSSGCSDF